MPGSHKFYVRLSLPTHESENKFFFRRGELAKLLHRSPDYVFLGELQTSEDTMIAFEGFSAGIRGLATTHCKSFQTLIARWTKNHKLSMDLVHSIDIIVICRKHIVNGKFSYTVDEIYECNSEKFDIILEREPQD